MTNEITMTPWRWGNPVEEGVAYLVWGSIDEWVVSKYITGIGWLAAGATPCDPPFDNELLEKVTHRSSSPLGNEGPLEPPTWTSGGEWSISADDIKRASYGAVERSKEMDRSQRQHMLDVCREARSQAPGGATHCRVHDMDLEWRGLMLVANSKIEYAIFTDDCDHLGWMKL